MFVVMIGGIEFYAYHGVTPEERAVGHRYRADLQLEVEGDADQSDDLAGTVDYGAAAETLIAVAQERSHQTVERAARRIGERLLADYPLIRSLTISLTKLAPPMPVVALEAGVRLTLSRPQ